MNISKLIHYLIIVLMMMFIISLFQTLIECKMNRENQKSIDTGTLYYSLYTNNNRETIYGTNKFTNRLSRIYSDLEVCKMASRTE